ncbi:MAG TPA: recombinase RecT [Myxococcales bacterium]|nr:recombinase RecT [Myxococcales bacterium]
MIRLSQEAKRRFPPALVSTIAATVGAPAVKAHDTPLLQRFLELSAALNLNPLMGEIWLAAIPSRNGSNQDRLAIMVGRDGYLKKAREHEDFIDVDADVVCENDVFAVKRRADGTRSVEHSYGHPTQRGQVVGAYAVLRRRGLPDRYFYAPLAEYAKDQEKSAWRYLHAMIVKAATSYILRTTYGVSGPVPYDELGAGLDLPGSGDGPGGADVAVQPLEPQVAALWERIREVDPTAFSEGELRARSQGATPVQLANLVRELEGWLSEAGEITDAEVVETPTFTDRDDLAFEGVAITGEGVAETFDLTGEEREIVPDDSLPLSESYGVSAPEVEAATDATWRAAQERWDTDEAWRTHISPFFDRYRELEALNSPDPDVDAELHWIEQQLVTFGAPLGWRPDEGDAGA